MKEEIVILQTWKRHFEYQDFEKIFPGSKAEEGNRDTPNGKSGLQVSDYSENSSESDLKRLGTRLYSDKSACDPQMARRNRPRYLTLSAKENNRPTAIGSRLLTQPVLFQITYTKAFTVRVMICTRVNGTAVCCRLLFFISKNQQN